MVNTDTDSLQQLMSILCILYTGAFHPSDAFQNAQNAQKAFCASVCNACNALWALQTLCFMSTPLDTHHGHQVPAELDVRVQLLVVKLGHSLLHAGQRLK
eukprot:1161515-Pelagomonas_calceolata.AAC.10